MYGTINVFLKIRQRKKFDTCQTYIHLAVPTRGGTVDDLNEMGNIFWLLNHKPQLSGANSIQGENIRVLMLKTFVAL